MNIIGDFSFINLHDTIHANIINNIELNLYIIDSTMFKTDIDDLTNYLEVCDDAVACIMDDLFLSGSFKTQKLMQFREYLLKKLENFVQFDNKTIEKVWKVLEKCKK